MAMLTRKRKITVSVTLSPNLINQLDELLDTGEFSGQSDIISQALSEFFVRYHARKGIFKVTGTETEGEGWSSGIEVVES